MPVSLIYFMPGLQNFGNSILCGKLVCFLQQVDHTYLSKDLSSAELQQRHTCTVLGQHIRHSATDTIYRTVVLVGNDQLLALCLVQDQLLIERLNGNRINHFHADTLRSQLFRRSQGIAH